MTALATASGVVLGLIALLSLSWPSLSAFTTVYTALWAVSAGGIALLGLAEDADLRDDLKACVLAWAGAVLLIVATCALTRTGVLEVFAPGLWVVGSEVSTATLVVGPLTLSIGLGDLVLIFAQILIGFAESGLFHVALPELLYRLTEGTGMEVAISSILPNLVFAAFHFRSWQALGALNPWRELAPAFAGGMAFTLVYLYYRENNQNVAGGVCLAHTLYNTMILLLRIIK